MTISSFTTWTSRILLPWLLVSLIASPSRKLAVLLPSVGTRILLYIRLTSSFCVRIDRSSQRPSPNVTLDPRGGHRRVWGLFLAFF
jgi:hypothetical protein